MFQYIVALIYQKYFRLYSEDAWFNLLKLNA
jgi:hypothetical protein